MFDLGAMELLVIGIVAIIVVGPKDLPKMLRAGGQFISKMRSMAREFQSMFEEAARDTGMDDLAKSVNDVKNFSVTGGAGKVLNPITGEADAIKKELESIESASVPVDAAAKDSTKAGGKTAARAAKKPTKAKKKSTTKSKSKSKSKTKQTG